MARPGIAHQLLLASTIAFLGVWLWVAVTAPDRVPHHFNLAGEVDRWGSKWSLLAAIGAIALILAAGFASALWWVGRIPPGPLNIPNKEYWVAPEHRAEFNRRFAADLALLGSFTVLLLASVLIASAHAARAGGDVPAGWLLVPTVAFVVATLTTVVWMAAFRYRVPDRDQAGARSR